MFTQLCDVDVHRAGIEVVVVNPNGFERKITFEYLVDVGAKQTEELGFLSGEFGHFVTNHKDLFLRIEGKFTYFVHGDVLTLLTFYSTKDSFQTEDEFFH